MGTVLGIKKSVYDKTEAKFRSGIRLAPEGANILWIIDDFKVGSFIDAKTGEDCEYLSFVCKMTDEDGEEYSYWQFFRTAEESDIQELKAFILAIGRSDWNPEDDDIDMLIGTKFKCDFTHYESKNKTTGKTEPKGRFEWKTLVPVNWKDGQPVGATKKAAAKPATKKVVEEVEEEEPAPQPRRRPREEPQEEYEDDDAGDSGDTGEDEEEPQGFKSFSPRRTQRRRVAAGDKD